MLSVPADISLPERRLKWLILGVVPFFAFLVMLAILIMRDFYDDELASIYFIHLPFRDITAAAIRFDIHPPGMYIADRIGYLATGSEKWLILLPLAVCMTGTWIFVNCLRSHLRTAWGGMLFSVLAFMHPNVLMWCNSLRWQPYFSGIALIVLALGLGQSSGAPDSCVVPAIPPVKRCVLLGALIGLLFYFNYVMPIFALSFAVAWCVRHGCSKGSFFRLALIAGVAAAVIMPLVPSVLKVQLPYANQVYEFGSIGSSALRLSQGLTVSQAVLPWAPVALLVLFAFLFPSTFGVMKIAWSDLRQRQESNKVLLSLLIFFLAAIGLAIISGLGLSSRNFVFLNIVSSFFLARGAEYIYKGHWRIAAGVVVAFWIGTGAYNLTFRTGTSKGSRNDHYDELASRIVEMAEGKPSVVVLNNYNLDYELNTVRLARDLPLSICTESSDHIHGLKPGLQGGMRPFERIIIVESYPFAEADDPSVPLLDTAYASISQPKVEERGLDTNASLKSFFSGETLPTYRYRITYGRALPLDWDALGLELSRIGPRRSRELHGLPRE